MAHDPAVGRHSLFASLKRRSYIVGSALGITLGILYAYSLLQEGANAGFVLTIGMILELIVFFVLFALAPQWIEILEVAFFVAMIGSLMLLGGMQIHTLYARQVLIPDKLGFIINSLVLWLTICLLGSFLALPFRYMRPLLALIWVGTALIAISAALVLRPPEEWRYSYLISGIAGLAALYIVSLLISRLGQRQQQQATTDALTGIANRHLLADLLTHHYRRAVAQQRNFAVILIDIDHFKTINDSLGHPVGDQVLMDVATTIAQNIRGADQVGRWGGDEFLVLLIDTDMLAARQVAERIRTALAQHVAGRAARATVSIGVHSYQTGQSIEEILACADKALYAAKQAGRDQVGVWDANANEK